MSNSTRPVLLSNIPASPMNRAVQYLFERYFDIQQYRSDQQYDPASTLIVAPIRDAEAWTHQLHEQGLPIVIDNLCKFCKENNLNSSCMRDIYYGRQKKHKEWVKVIKLTDNVKKRSLINQASFFILLLRKICLQ